MTNIHGIQSLIEIGSDFIGKVLPKTLIGYFSNGTQGALTGALIGATETSWATTLKLVGNEISERLLGTRGSQRVGAVLVYAHEKFIENINSGKEIKSNYLHSNDSPTRVPADEDLEAVLLLAQKEYEEKKLKFIGNLMGNLPFYKEFSKEHSIQLIKLAESLTYRQYLLLILFCQPMEAKRNFFNLYSLNYRNRRNFSQPLISVLQDTFDLYKIGLLNCQDDALIDMLGICPYKMTTQGNGVNIVNLLELHKISLDDQKAVANIFSF